MSSKQPSEPKGNTSCDEQQLPFRRAVALARSGDQSANTALAQEYHSDPNASRTASIVHQILTLPYSRQVILLPSEILPPLF